MNFAYVASDNSASDGETLGVAGQDISVKKVIFGTPADGKVTYFHNSRVSTGHADGMGSVATTNLACAITQPTHAEGCDWLREVDFTANGCQGLPLDGGSFHTDASAVTVIWEPVDEAV